MGNYSTKQPLRVYNCQRSKNKDDIFHDFDVDDRIDFIKCVDFTTELGEVCDTNYSISACMHTLLDYENTPMNDLDLEESGSILDAIEKINEHDGNYQVIATRIVKDLNQIKQCLLQGCPIIMGIEVYDMKFYNCTLPDDTNEYLGNHCIILCGFISYENDGLFIFRNSWGSDWGKDGYGYISYKYVLDRKLSFDLFTIKTMEIKNQSENFRNLRIKNDYLKSQQPLALRRPKTILQHLFTF
jgi:C1A family cysteine protease